jgi:hypothetical protein
VEHGPSTCPDTEKNLPLCSSASQGPHLSHPRSYVSEEGTAVYSLRETCRWPQGDGLGPLRPQGDGLGEGPQGYGLGPLRMTVGLKAGAGLRPENELRV